MSTGTLCFIDFESTGLFERRLPIGAYKGQEDSYRKALALPRFVNDCRITQIGAVALQVADFEALLGKTGNRTDYNTVDLSMAKTYDRTVNPELDETGWRRYSTRPPGASYLRSALEITGLTRTQLESSPSLTTLWPDWLAFLSSLPSPLYLIAHNGAAFDFRLVESECDRLRLEKIGSHLAHSSLLDTTFAFKDLDDLYLRLFKKDELLVQSPLSSARRNRQQKYRARFRTNQTSTMWHNYALSLQKVWSSHFGRNRPFPDAHSGVGDATAMLRLALLYGRDFINYLQQNHFSF